MKFSLEIPLVTPRTIPRTPMLFQLNNYSDNAIDDNVIDNDIIDDILKSSLDRAPLVTPSQVIPSIVILHTIKKKARKLRVEHSWTLKYYDIHVLETTWVNQAKKGKPTLVDRLWVCKYYNKFDSIDSS